MKKKDLIDVILKIGGLFMVLKTITANLTAIILMFLNGINSDTIIFTLISIFIIVLIFYFFVLKTKILLSLMKIDHDSLVFKNSDLNKTNILSTGIILIGVFMVVNSIATLLIEVTDLILTTVTTGNGHFDWYPLVYLFIGLILIIKSNRIIKFIKN